jgi:hypothetical protein
MARDSIGRLLKSASTIEKSSTARIMVPQHWVRIFALKDGMLEPERLCQKLVYLMLQLYSWNSRLRRLSKWISLRTTYLVIIIIIIIIITFEL